MIIKMFTKLRRGMDEHRISIELEDIKKNQKELKNTITETKRP